MVLAWTSHGLCIIDTTSWNQSIVLSYFSASQHGLIEAELYCCNTLNSGTFIAENPQREQVKYDNDNGAAGTEDMLTLAKAFATSSELSGGINVQEVFVQIWFKG